MSDSEITTKKVNVNSHSAEGTHWLAYRNENYFDCYGCLPPKLLSYLIKENNWRKSLFKIQNPRKRRLL